VKFFQDNGNAKIIMLYIPHLHDSSDNTYVNKEIKIFNSKLKKSAKLFNHVTILEFISNRNLFTQHCLHQNGYGKGLSAKQIASLIYKLRDKKPEKPISLTWKMEEIKKEIVIPTTILLIIIIFI
jgi:hypothetical protein